MEREPKTPQEREKDLKISYAISFYDFMESFTFKKIPKMPKIRYVEWLNSESIVRIYQMGKKYTVFETTSGDVETTLDITQDCAEQAMLYKVNNTTGIQEERNMNLDDWDHLYTIIMQYDENETTWSSEE